MIQLRLICNLLDGMVAVEGGMKTACGDIYNDLPDRISDSLIILGIAYGLTGVNHAAELGWAAVLLVSPPQAARSDNNTPDGGTGGNFDYNSLPEPTASTLALPGPGIAMMRRHRS